ncbi:MAG: GNAT family N-acetyltransferase [Acidobacteria bacterium RIFCSPLOWO2_02_FULL_68_18]|nr:MAG: GNAT family N-acetyltransferase [Acidobacteria bacterium RIFCSPLOWO2_02_FULL_68_18]OFW50383.1 MAG: GNAT family N-acetyltransferase [Acidobacteria bacterium RIFCSPLOWO2_12_FULL_68_19]
MSQFASSADIVVRPLREADLDLADQVLRLAFGTFLGAPDPARFMGDVAYVRPRWRSDPGAAFAAEIGGVLVGSNFAANWGSVGYFGPLTVRPDLWDRGIASRLMAPVLERFAAWGTRQAGLFTFPHSPKHLSLYQKFGFWPRSLTPIMSRSVRAAGGTAGWSRFSDVPRAEQAAMLVQCRELTTAVYEGLDLTREIAAVEAHRLGESVLVWDGGRLVALAVCHYGAGTEGGSGACYVKFGAARPGPRAGEHFGQLLDACEALAARERLPRLVAGVSTARHEAYRQMLGRGFRADRLGVAMHRGNDAGYHRAGVFAVDDWR